jgi:4-hydroxybenzoate polyprenyltransferase
MPARAHLQLLRPANVVTAAANVLAGYAAADFGNPRALPWLIVAGMCLYGGGVVLNDFYDRKLDAIERPERPIPSGRASARTAAFLGMALLASGVLSAVLASGLAAGIAAVIACLAAFYDCCGKRNAVIGPVTVALCRGLNLMLGMAAVPAMAMARWPLALLPFSYICAVTVLSRGEVHGGGRGAGVFSLLSLGLVIAALLWLSLSHPGAFAGILLTLLLAWRVLPPFWRAYREMSAHRIRDAVKTGVISLVILDAVIGAVYGGPAYAALILATGIAAAALARMFAVT